MSFCVNVAFGWVVVVVVIFLIVIIINVMFS